MEQRTFESWYAGELERTFGLNEKENAPGLKAWVSSEHSIPSELANSVEKLRQLLRKKRNSWNEDELKLLFIGPLLSLVNFEGEGFSSFANRSLKAVKDGVELSGKVDWMAAAGDWAPETPFFFIHEYKQLKVGSPDPMGQVLATMLAAQTQNDDGQPIYGCYVVADCWRFVLLDGKTYAFTQGYDATDKTELQTVWSILSEVKLRIEKRAVEIFEKK